MGALPVCAQQSWLAPSDTLNGKRLLVVTGVTATGTVIAISALSQMWYADYPRGSFRFFNDNSEWLQMDKAGHFFSAYQISLNGYEAFRWTGLSESKSILAGTATSLIFLTAIEVMDGFSTGWGFSAGDLAANFAGASAFAAQQLFWNEQKFNIKFSYSPSEFAQYRPELLGQSSLERLVKDYNGQTYWLSLNVASIAGVKHSRLPWLNVAFGYSANGMLGGFSNPAESSDGIAMPSFERSRQFLLSFDVDTRRIPTRSHLLKTLFSVVGFIKLPAPAIEFSNGEVKGHWIYF